ncbi:glycosyl transferase family 41-domain-containing protein [Clohesyomyces aquaticus]|uniref:protein O-GlcNAc transferase n=1 Tax=Clohesyomyces aquaticus TaxID=1231657 RepID=A0A1Y1ZLA1_9PLEO|nr:glycosyl transferase family 41-domain-containing protein [Clohesyomyces aquaticus]
MTMVRQHPPPPQPQPPPPPQILPALGPYGTHPISRRNSLLQNAPGFEQREIQAQPMPQRYAHPLSRHNSYGHQSGSLEHGSGSPKPPEHMLRRKTPNGILAAAYDGTSVEEMEKPHATKHILLPVTTNSRLSRPHAFSYTLRQELPLRSPGMNHDFDHGKQDPLADWNPSLYFETGSGRTHDGWKASHHALPQIDSMLNQMPQHPMPLQYQMYGQRFCGAMAPSLQSPLGPTVSNDQGPFGPYWHDGTFIPYKPAALRDPRYFPHHGSDWNVPQPGPFLHTGPNEWHAYNHPVSNITSLQQHPYSLQQPIPSPSTYNLGRPSIDYPVPYPPSHSLNIPLDYQNQPVALLYPQRPQQDLTTSLSSSGQTTPVADHTPLSTPLSEFGPESRNAQTRERVFAWAHTVYIDLLKYLQQTRKSSAQHRHPNAPQQHSRPHIYPKPPRQPGASFSNTSNSVGNPQVLGRHNSYPSASKYAPGSQDPAVPPQRRNDQSHHRSTSLWSASSGDGREMDSHRRNWHQPTQQHYQGPQGFHGHTQSMDTTRTLRRVSGTSIAGVQLSLRNEIPPSMTAASALESIHNHCEESKWNWIDGILLGGCLAYALGDYQKAQDWYKHILILDKDHVEATSNLAATLLALHQKDEAERYWRRAVKLRPSYFEAVEHLIGLLCSDHRGQEAVQVIEEVERSLKFIKKGDVLKNSDLLSDRSSSVSQSPSISETSDKPVFEFDGENDETVFKDLDELPGSDQPGFGSSGYAIPGSENGRILALVHAKGNMLYALGNNVGNRGLIKHILSVVGYDAAERSPSGRRVPPSSDPILLHPEPALKTSQLCFPQHGQLPGLKYVPSEGMARKAAVSTTSNSLLSLAKIFQDGMATNSPKASAYQTTYGVREILALYYLSLSLQPSPSTANNVGILLASVQQHSPSRNIPVSTPIPKPQIPGLVPGSGVALALAYYNYGLLLDSRHAHLYTNLGSLLKDIGQLDVAIQMYEQAVNCDGNFDIALANLANAVKDKGRISDAIGYYKRAVAASPDFAEAVCGLANALNSVCGWSGRGGIANDHGSRDRWHVDERGLLLDARLPGASSFGWIKRVVDLVEKQLADGENWGRGSMDLKFIDDVLRPLDLIHGVSIDTEDKKNPLIFALGDWQGKKWEGARAVRLVERAIRMITWQWYQDKYVNHRPRPSTSYQRPRLPSSLTVPAAPTVLPFHTFTCPMSAKQIRLISQRNGLRISCSTLRAPWLPVTVFPPPPPPNPYFKVGYVSSDFNNHPLAHLMQSVFGLHNPSRVKAYCYATTASDGSIHRQQIEREAPVFYDASSWQPERLVHQITQDGIHILINLNGYTRGARNEVFAARPAPIQMSFMGFAGTLGAEWCDYLLADTTAVPMDTRRPHRDNLDVEDLVKDNNSGGDDENWVYGENIIYCRDTFFCCDHRQSAPDAQEPQLTWEDEQQRRWAMRKEIFPDLPDEAIILGNFNQLYKIEPTTFRTWLRILAKLPNAVLWLLRFPDLGEHNLKQTAVQWAGQEVANRIIFTDVAQKHQHIARARVCDLFLDTPECNAHTTAADVLWSGTPLLTLPRYKYKMCSRMAASILKGALPKSEAGAQAAKVLIAADDDDYEEKAVRLGQNCVYQGHRATGQLSQLRRMLYESRWTSALFDTRRWVRDLEEAYEIAWQRWEKGVGGDIMLEPQRKF